MKLYTLALSFLPLVVGSTWPDPARESDAGERAADVRAIRAHIEEVFRAYAAHDRAGVRRTHATNWRGFLTGSRGVIRGIEAYMAQAEPVLAARAQMLDHTVRDFDIVFYGDVAVVNYIADLDWGLDGRPAGRNTLRILDVYVREAGSWNQAASQVAPHPDELAARSQLPQPISPEERTRLLTDREAVWQAFFANDRVALARVVPEDLVAINAGEEPWADRVGTLAAAAAFAAGGARLVRLEFPKTEIRIYGDTAILYSTYVYDVQKDGKFETSAGRGTEIFVRRDGRWVNAGWHLDSGR